MKTIINKIRALISPNFLKLIYILTPFVVVIIYTITVYLINIIKRKNMKFFINENFTITQMYKGEHNGIDISLKSDTPLIATTDLICLLSETHPKGGKQIVLLDAKTNEKFGFAHLNKSFVNKGSLIKQGEKFALSGNTGLSTGPHLHFTYRKDNIISNPIDYLTKKGVKYVVR